MCLIYHAMRFSSICKRRVDIFFIIVCVDDKSISDTGNPYHVACMRICKIYGGLTYNQKVHSPYVHQCSS